MSIGRVGMWPVDAPDVLDVHAYVYFDGNALFVQSADPGNPAKGNGRPIATTWQQIEIPCTIEMGRARLVYRTLDEMDEDDEDKTVAQAIQLPTMPKAQFTANAGAFSNRNQAPDSDATRLQPMSASREPDPTVVSPLEMAGTPMGGVPKARPAAGMPAWATNDIAPQSSPTAIGAPPAPPPPQNMGYQAFGSVQVAVPPPPPAPPNMMAQTLNSPMQQPATMPNMQPMQGMPMQPGMMQQPMMMMQPGMQPGMMPMAGQSGPLMALPPGSPAAETGRVVPPSELKGFARAKAEWAAMPPIRKIIIGTFPGVLLLVYFMLFEDEPQQQARRPRPQPSITASAASAPSTTATPSATPVVTTSPPPSATVSVAIPTPSVTATVVTPNPPTSASSAPLLKGKRTLEREAVDLATQGKYIQAAELYEQLATQHPDQPAYREAARILRTRGNGG